MLLSEVVERYIEARPGMKSGSADQLIYSVRAFDNFAGAIHVEQINNDLLVSFMRSRMRRCSPATVSRNVKDICTILKFAAKRLRLNVSVPDVEPVAIPRPIPTAWTMAEMEQIIAVCGRLPGTMRNLAVRQSEWWMALVLFLYDTGARIQAALALDPRDFHPQNCVAVLRGEHAKTGLEQVVDIGPDTTAAIKRVLESRDWLEPVVFRYPWATRKLWLDFHSILTAAGLSSGKYVGFHRIRKTHATQQVIAVGWEQARVALGHSSESITRCYVDVRQLPRQPLLIPRPSIR